MFDISKIQSRFNSDMKFGCFMLAVSVGLTVIFFNGQLYKGFQTLSEQKTGWFVILNYVCVIFVAILFGGSFRKSEKDFALLYPTFNLNCFDGYRLCFTLHSFTLSLFGTLMVKNWSEDFLNSFILVLFFSLQIFAIGFGQVRVFLEFTSSEHLRTFWKLYRKPFMGVAFCYAVMNLVFSLVYKYYV